MIDRLAIAALIFCIFVSFGGLVSFRRVDAPTNLNSSSGRDILLGLIRVLGSLNRRFKRALLLVGCVVSMIAVGAALRAGLSVVHLLAACVAATAVRTVLRQVSDDRKVREIERQIVIVIEQLSHQLAAGNSMNGALLTLDTPLGRELQQCCASDGVRVGVAAWAFELSRYRLAQDLANCVELATLSGAPVANLLSELRAQHLLETQQQASLSASIAQARSSAWMLGLMPLVFGVALSFLVPSTIELLFGSTLGGGLLLAATTLQVLGLFWMRKILGRCANVF